MPELILHPDLLFPGPTDVEASVYGDAFDLFALHAGETGGIPDDVLERTAAVVCYNDSAVTPEMLDRMPRCRVIVRAGVGYNDIDIAAAGARGVTVCNTPDYGTMDVADHAIALTLALARGIPQFDRALYEDPIGGWKFDWVPTIRRLNDLTFGVVGLGRIGTAAALRAKALGMTVIFHDPYRTTGTELSLGLDRADTLQELLSRSDVVSLHTPLTQETRHLIGAAELAAMKPDAFLINTSRGGVVDLVALTEALLAGRLAAAGLDVLEVEPLDTAHPLMQAWRAPGSAIRDRLLVTPHSAFYSASSLADLRRKSAATAMAFLRTGASRDCVNAGFIDRAKAEARARTAR
jgi:phosphoglycerate dehydrogenase-like enzyme